MKKKIVICSMSLSLLLIIVFGGVFMFKWNKPRTEETPSKSGILIINNEVVSTDNVTIHFKKNANYADLPLTEVLKALEFYVKWLDNSTAEITYKDTKYMLDLSEVSLVKQNNALNLIDLVDGGKRTYTVLDKELILDSVTILCSLQEMGVKANVHIDSEELKVNIVNRTD